MSKDRRAPFQVLVFPYTIDKGKILYCIFRRSDLKVWQGIAGGGEKGESPIEAAIRECNEEAGILEDNNFTQLDSLSHISVIDITGVFLWGESILVIPEYCFGVHITYKNLKLSDEHTDYCWTSYEKAHKKLKWDSNKTALWELNERIKRSGR